MKRAFQDAGLSPEQISYINAHGTGTEANDKAECKAVRKVFGERAARVPISSTKSMVGHCLGAAGAVEAIASIVCAEAGVFPATANFTEAREGCAVDCVPEAGRAWSGEKVFLSNNSAFGGHNASVVLRGPPGGGTFWSPQTSGGSDKNVAAPKEPICLTACGVVSSLGLGAETLAGEQSGLRSVSLPQLPPILAGMVDEQAVEKFDRRLDLRNMDRSSRWVTLAARLAIREAGFSEKPAALAELGLFLNLSAGPSWAESEYLTSFLSNNRQVAQLTAFPYIVPSSVTGNVCRALMLAGANLTLNGGPGAGLLGLGPALAALRSGHAEALLHGAVDELSERILADNFSAGLLSGDGALAPGEGAAVVMLETVRHTQARGAKPLALVCGAAFGTEVGHCWQPDPDSLSLEQVVSEALEEAGIRPQEVSVVCASTSRTRLAGLAARFCPAWMERVFSVAPRTGSLEGAQPLVDVAATLRKGDVAAGQFILAVASSPHGVNGAVVFKKIDNFA